MLLSSFSSSCGVLKGLWLQGCYKVTDRGLQALGLLTSLHLLNLHECWQITAAGLAALSSTLLPRHSLYSSPSSGCKMLRRDDQPSCVESRCWGGS